MHGECAIPPVDQIDRSEVPDRSDDPVLVRLIGAVDDDLSFEGGSLCHEPLDGEDVATRLTDGRREFTKNPRDVLQAHPKADRILR